MRYRKLKARQIFDGYDFREGKVLVLQADGTVEALVPEMEAGEEIETFDGILMPGLINCHCHLELSAMKDMIPNGTGLVPFLLSVIQQRGQLTEAAKALAIAAAEKEMYNNGIVAVADICNTTDTV